MKEMRRYTFSHSVDTEVVTRSALRRTGCH